MRTNTKGRSGARTGSKLNRFGSFSSGMGSRTTGRTGGKTGSGSMKRAGAVVGVASSYKNVATCFNCKITSFRTLMNQTKGPARFPRPTPTTLNSFANWINKGAVVQTCSAAQVAKWARTTKKNFNASTPSTTACKNVLTAKFGKSTIKAIARTKTGSFMVATSPTCKGRAFNFPK